LDENRLPLKIVDVEAELSTLKDYSALGYLTGRLLGSTVPIFRGIVSPDLESLKALGAASATSGGIALYHIEGVTPEAINQPRSSLASLERITVEAGDLEEATSRFTCDVDDPIICLGCPHCSLKELRSLSGLLASGHLKRRLIAFTSRGVYDEALRQGYVGAIEEAGGQVFRDTCMVVAPLKEMGWREISVNSCKAAHYASSMGIVARLGDVEELVREAMG
jgi:predicted aconitase